MKLSISDNKDKEDIQKSQVIGKPQIFKNINKNIKESSKTLLIECLIRNIKCLSSIL